MEETIYKYQFEITDEFSIEMPYGAKILSAFEQAGIACMWVRVQPNIGATTVRRFMVFGTGHPIPINIGLKHISTFPMVDGRFIWHLFEVS